MRNTRRSLAIATDHATTGQATGHRVKVEEAIPRYHLTPNVATKTKPPLTVSKRASGARPRHNYTHESDHVVALYVKFVLKLN